MLKLIQTLTFDQHINNIVSKASSRIGTLFRGFCTRNPILLRKAYVSYIQPIFEYASNVWSPHLVKHIHLIESVQRRFTKRIPALSNLPYAERLVFLDIETLEYRRLKSDLVFYYKILNGVTLWPSDMYFTIQSHQREIRHTINRSTLYLEQPLCKTALFANDFFQRCISIWNDLPNNVVEATSVKCFKDVEQRRSVKILKFNF